MITIFLGWLAVFIPLLVALVGGGYVAVRVVRRELRSDVRYRVATAYVKFAGEAHKHLCYQYQRDLENTLYGWAGPEPIRHDCPHPTYNHRRRRPPGRNFDGHRTGGTGGNVGKYLEFGNPFPIPEKPGTIVAEAKKNSTKTVGNISPNPRAGGNGKANTEVKAVAVNGATILPDALARWRCACFPNYLKTSMR